MEDLLIRNRKPARPQGHSVYGEIIALLMSFQVLASNLLPKSPWLCHESPTWWWLSQQQLSPGFYGVTMEMSSGLTCPLMHPPCPACVTCSHGIFPCTNKADFRSHNILSLGDMDADSCSMRSNQTLGMNFQMPSASHPYGMENWHDFLELSLWRMGAVMLL